MTSIPTFAAMLASATASAERARAEADAPDQALTVDRPAADTQASPESDEPATAHERAVALLAELLADGPMSAAEIAAKAEGISERTLQRAADQLGVIKAKSGFSAGWTWALPAKAAA